MLKQVNKLGKDKLSKELIFRNKRISTIQIETLETSKNSKFVLGTFFIYMKGKKCYFTEKNEELFFDKIFEFSKNYDKKIIVFFKSGKFDTKFLIRYCSKKLNISPTIEQYNFKTLQIRIPEFNIYFKEIDNSINKVGMIIHKRDEKRNISSDILKYKSKKIDIKYNIQNMINSKDKKIVSKGYKILTEKINYDTIEMYKAIQPYCHNRDIFC